MTYHHNNPILFDIDDLIIEQFKKLFPVFRPPVSYIDPVE